MSELREGRSSTDSSPADRLRRVLSGISTLPGQELDEPVELPPLPPGFIRVTVKHHNRETLEVVDAAELAHLQAQQRAALEQLRRSEELFIVPEWVRLHPLLGSYLAEGIGTFAYTLIVSLAKSSVQENAFVLESTTRMDMLPTGLILTALIFALGYISGGHFNPAISLAVLLVRKIEFGLFLGYLIVQLAAGLGAGLFAMLILNDNEIFVPNVSSEYISSGVFSELIFTLAIALVALNTRYSLQACNFYYAIAVGMTVAAGSACAGRISGGSFNPAAATGLQAAVCLAGNCDALKVFWVYWVAPLLGAGFAAFLFSQMDQPTDSPILLRDEKVIPPQAPEKALHPSRNTAQQVQGYSERRRSKRRGMGSPVPTSASMVSTLERDRDWSVGDSGAPPSPMSALTALREQQAADSRSHYVHFEEKEINEEEPRERFSKV